MHICKTFCTVKYNSSFLFCKLTKYILSIFEIKPMNLGTLLLKKSEKGVISPAIKIDARGKNTAQNFQKSFENAVEWIFRR